MPDPTDVLCERCGYVLTGLPEAGRCPECGTPVADSIGTARLPPPWETPDPVTGPSPARRFWATTARVILRPRDFYRTFAVRRETPAARRFARLHWWLSGGLLGLTCAVHSDWYAFRVMSWSPPPFPGGEAAVVAALFAFYTLLIYGVLDLVTRLAGKLTTWEGTYRGLRLPYPTVLRGLYYHAAHYLPVAAVALAVVGGYQLLLLADPGLTMSAAVTIGYLYVLAGLVVASAVYLFQTYWIGMRNMMYANR